MNHFYRNLYWDLEVATSLCVEKGFRPNAHHFEHILKIRELSMTHPSARSLLNQINHARFLFPRNLTIYDIYEICGVNSDVQTEIKNPVENVP